MTRQTSNCRVFTSSGLNCRVLTSFGLISAVYAALANWPGNIWGRVSRMDGKSLGQIEPFRVGHAARVLITKFGDRAPVIARGHAERCFKASAEEEARKWLEVADAVACFLPGPVAKSGRSRL